MVVAGPSLTTLSVIPGSRTLRSTLNDLHPDVAEDRRLTWRQISQPRLPAEFGDLALGSKPGQRLVDGVGQRGIAGEPDIAAIGPDRIVVAGRGDRCIGVRGAMGVEAAEVDQRRVIVAAGKCTEEIIAAGEEMCDVVDQAPFVEVHEDRIAERAALDDEAQAREIADIADLATPRLRSEH